MGLWVCGDGKMGNGLQNEMGIGLIAKWKGSERV
jgi:hypothetical protein